MIDFLIVGAGPSGLYMAQRLEDIYASKNIQIVMLEKSGIIGGRTRQVRFHSKLINTGAGVGRYDKDRLLIQSLQRTLPSYSIQPKVRNLCYQMDHPVSTSHYIQQLKKPKQHKWIQQHRSTHSFQQCFLHFFTPLDYTRFCQSNGFTDFERADIVDTLYDYGFEDNQMGQRYFDMPWNRWTRGLRKSLRKTTIYFHQNVLQCQKRSDGLFQVLTDKKKQWITKYVIYAGSLNPLPYPDIRNAIGSQSFLRLYVYLKNKDVLHTKGTFYREDVFQKSIVLSPRIQMLSYSDNEHADRVHPMTRHEMEKRSGLTILDWKSFYWREGTHFFYPLETTRFPTRDAFIQYAQFPEPHVFFVGEAISNNQGWTEGALESVENIVNYLINYIHE